MKIRVHFGIGIIFGSIMLTFTNCSQNAPSDRFRSLETIVGNPMTVAAKTLLTKVCSVITRCHAQVNETTCETGVLNTTGIDYQLGLAKGSITAFSDIVQSEDLGSLVANPSGVSSCMAAVDNLTCADPSVLGAYNTFNNSFAGVAYMIPTSPGSCPAIFNQPPSRLEYYVATIGNDGDDGSREHPWATITHAAQNLVPGPEGAIVHVAPGNYNLTALAACSTTGGSCGIRTTRSGTAAAPIVFISDQQGGAKIVAPGASTIWYNTGDYVRIVGFEMVGSSSSNFGILSEGAYGKMIGNHIHSIPMTTGCATSNSGGGIFFGYFPGANDNDATGNLIHDIGPILGNGLAEASYCSGMAFGISYDQPRGKVQNNIIYRSASWGLGTWHSASNMQISHNLFFNNGALASNGALLGGAIMISGELSVGVHDDTTVANNIIRDNSGKGLYEYVAVGNRNVYVNNIMYSNGSDYDLKSGVIPSGTMTSDPLMLNFNINGSGDYHLQASSPAINAGSIACALATGNGACTPAEDYTGFARPFGPGLDIGPYEWHP